jgi:hypothetical protein
MTKKEADHGKTTFERGTINADLMISTIPQINRKLIQGLRDAWQDKAGKVAERPIEDFSTEKTENYWDSTVRSGNGDEQSDT